MPHSNLAVNLPQLPSGSNTSHHEQAPASTATTAEDTGYSTPVAPAYSPITPKPQPVFPATYPIPTDQPPLPPRYDSTTAPEAPTANAGQIAPAEYIAQPPPRPFSSEDSTDAIALRAAISTLQFQKKKAQEDIKALENIRRKAVDEPELFKNELAAGRLKEQRPKAADLQAILDETDTDEEEADDDAMQVDSDKAPFESIPGPQNVARMPNINWEKYHINGEALDRLHEQQRRWPGSFDYGQRRGPEFAVAAPYSPWQDVLDTPQNGRKDSHTAPGSAILGVTSEHPMETRRGGRH